MKKVLKYILCIIGAIDCPVIRKKGKINTQTVKRTKNVALKGYDVTCYFTEGEARRGFREYHYEYDGVVWFFISKKNKALFAKNPKKYIPQYGGYCSFGVAVKQKKFNVDPKVWHIEHEKLYLNYNPQTKNIWITDCKKYIKEADQYWVEAVRSKGR